MQASLPAADSIHKLLYKLLMVYTSFSASCGWYIMSLNKLLIVQYKLLYKMRMVHHKLLQSADGTPHAPPQAADSEHYKLFCELLMVYTSFSASCGWYTQAPLQAADGSLQASLRATDSIHKLHYKLLMVYTTFSVS